MTDSLPLPARIDLATAADLQSALLGRMGSPLTLEGEAVRTVSAPALQVLLSAAKTWRHNAHELTVEKPSAALLGQLAVAGLSLDDIQSLPGETS